MTTAEQLLGLARAMGKEVSANGHVMDTWYDDDIGEDVEGFVTFDPANNADQAISVWCWLVATQNIMDTGGCLSLMHNNTPPLCTFVYADPAQWRQAVTDAAVRVCMGVKP